MGSTTINVLFHAITVALVPLTLAAAAAALVIVAKQCWLSPVMKWLLGIIISVCALYLSFLMMTSMGFGKAPPPAEGPSAHFPGNAGTGQIVYRKAIDLSSPVML